jgi:electron transfer flavoprotein beta subunit
MKIVVLIKQVPDTWGERRLDTATGLLDRDDADRVIDEIGERALEVALSQKDHDKSTEVVIMTMGPAPALEALRKALSMGGDSAVHVLDDALVGSDALRTSTVLAAALQRTGFDLVVAGNESTDGRGGVVPAMLAELLGVPVLSNLDEVDVDAGAVSGSRTIDGGTARVHAALPAIASVTERTPEARFPNLKGIMGAKRKPVEVLTAAELGVDPAGLAGSVVLSTTERPPRAAGTVIDDDGTAAAQLVEYLAGNRLI